MNSRQAQVAIHLAALLFGLAGIFGELIQASAILITAGRAGFAALALLLVLMHSGHRPLWPGRRKGGILFLAGVLLAAHWVTFFIAVKAGGVAIATLGFASFPAFVTLLEAVFYRERIRRSEWWVIAWVTIGLVLVTPRFSLQVQATTGLVWALASGLTFALFTLVNRRAVQSLSALTVAGWENACVAVLTLPWCLSSWAGLSGLDWLWLFALGVFCTALSHTLLVSSLTHLSARSAGIVIALEPVYAIVFAALLFAQYPSGRAIAGAILIVGAIAWAGTRRRQTD